MFAVGRRRSCRVARVADACVPALCGGYARAALCGPLVAFRPPGDLKTTTNPHCIALGPPPVSPSLHRASFQKSARGGRTPNRFYRTRAPLPNTSSGFQCTGSNAKAHKNTGGFPKTRDRRRFFFACGAKGPEKTRSYLGSYLPFPTPLHADGLVHTSHTPPSSSQSGT